MPAQSRRALRSRRGPTIRPRATLDGRGADHDHGAAVGPLLLVLRRPRRPPRRTGPGRRPRRRWGRRQAAVRLGGGAALGGRSRSVAGRNRVDRPRRVLSCHCCARCGDDRRCGTRSDDSGVRPDHRGGRATHHEVRGSHPSHRWRTARPRAHLSGRGAGQGERKSVDRPGPRAKVPVLVDDSDGR
jgi:hypothetical protein